MRDHRFQILMLALMLATSMLAGCTGSDPKEGDEPQIIGIDPNAGKPKAKNATEDPNMKNTPKAHFHHYWGDLKNVTIFGEPTGEGAPVTLTGPTFEYFSDGSLYGATFNLEDDGDDVTRTSNPVENGKADTVFVGTKEIRVRIDWSSAFVDQVFFKWQPANTNKYQPEGNGTAFLPGEQHTIPLRSVGESDPAHQFAISRWSFRLWAAGDAGTGAASGGGGLPRVPTFAVEPDLQVFVHMVAVNGGESFLDPPHPNFWTESDEISLGDLDPTTVDEPAVMTPVARVADPRMTDISLPPGNIVPLGTEKVIVKLKYETTFPPVEPEGFSLGLSYHGADTLKYGFLGLPTTTDGPWRVWEISTSDPNDPEAEIKVDGPYETNSQWRFELVPMIQDGSDPGDLDGSNLQRYTLGWAGSYQMQFSATKIPGFVLV